MSKQARPDKNEGLVEVLVDVSRVTKVVKGGRKFSFSACIISGDKQGSIGYGHGKAKEVTEARAKASGSAKKSMIKVPLYQARTIHHDVMGVSGASKVIIRRAKAGTGIIAAGAMRAIFESIGIHDVVAKSLGSGNVYTLIAATFEALKKLNTPKTIAEKRGIKISELGTYPKKLQKIEEVESDDK
ncbi:MAG: 30S ribosomal protein S5 [Alphaproteobacteria bacterium]|nr:30S ribosomal protein S5 [Alphaproteobacteria bacterium]